MKEKSAIIIGSGIAGLACAARLAAAGWQVDVFEKNHYAGGKLGLLEKEGYSFDTGPSLFTQPFLLEELFAACGKNITEYFTYRLLDEGTQYFWPDGTRLHARPEALSDELTKSGIPHNPGDLKRYLEAAAAAYNHIGRIFLDEPIHQIKTWMSRRIISALGHTKLSYLTQSLHAYNAAALRHPKLIQIFDRFATYNGSDPYRCPAMLSQIAHLEFGEPVGYPEGGMASIPRAVQRLCEDLGVRFHFGADVEKIIVENRRATGVQIAGGRTTADAIISNSDVYYTYANLLRDDVKAAAIQKQERSTSGVVFYWGVQKAFPELRLHNIFFSEDYKQEFADLRTGRLPADPTVYLNITSKMNGEHAPAGSENWFVLVNAPPSGGKRGKGKADSDGQAIQRLKDAVIQKISRALKQDVEPLIVTEDVLDPTGIDAQTGSYLGALYGTASNSAMAAFNRHPNQSSKYAGLYFCGGTVHPGGGIPLCLRSGRLAAAAVKRCG